MWLSIRSEVLLRCIEGKEAAGSSGLGNTDLPTHCLQLPTPACFLSILPSASAFITSSLLPIDSLPPKTELSSFHFTFQALPPFREQCGKPLSLHTDLEMQSLFPSMPACPEVIAQDIMDARNRCGEFRVGETEMTNQSDTRIGRAVMAAGTLDSTYTACNQSNCQQRPTLTPPFLPSSVPLLPPRSAVQS